jgi:eukaryotic-like serine/threonine-protein kinase
VTWIPDSSLDRLREVAEWPELEDTKYAILERIGRGGMGTVYLARDRELERHVALKVLSSPAPEQEETARILAEARILASLEHPGIVPVHDVGTLPDGRVFYVMKLVRGSRLDERVRQGGSLAELLRLFEKICETVAFAHAHGVIHRDLKPENIMLGAFGEVLVMDWGVAKLRADRSSHESSARAPLSAGDTSTIPGTVLGTPGYMAPEQASGAVALIDERTDVFALGGILYYMLTGRPPAVDGGAGAAALRWDGSVPRALRAVCLKARAQEPEARYQSAQQLAADVSDFLAGLPVAAYREGPIERARRLASKYRTPILLVSAYLLMRVLLLVLTRR